MVNLREKPFYLNDREIQWVEDTIGGMTLEEKLGQLFILLKTTPGVNEDAIEAVLRQSHQGGLRWQGGDKKTAYRQNMTYQKHSRIPLLIAANCDDGGSGCLPEGVFVATAAEAGAAADNETAYHIGLVAGREASAIGCNWMLNPISDIYMNWRNTIVNTRAFGSDADTVLRCARAYIRGVKDANPHMACTAKHFPGDGVEELDQHLALGVNDLSAEDWEASFGRVYRGLIDEGLEAVMVGHIALPDMSRRLRPGIRDTDIMPASLAPELLTDLLRGDMGFNGVIVTDASHMIGLSAMASRETAVPGVIAAGCDMFLFANDLEEDMGYMQKGYENGVITEERLSDALHRILGLKAHLRLYEDAVRFPDRSGLSAVGCAAHKAYAAEAADACITLVKDTQRLLPLDPAEKKRAYLVYVGSLPNGRNDAADPVRQAVKEELENAGFDVTVCKSFYDLERENGPSPMNLPSMMEQGARKAFKAAYDVVILVFNIKGYAQENCVRVRWSCNHSRELPWYITEAPTVGISLNYTNHLIDVPQIKTFVNAYGADRTHIRAAIAKLTGRSVFRGQANDTVFCGRWETRL